MVDKRMAGDYEIIQSMMIGDKEIVLGENPKDTGGLPYMCAFCEDNGIVARFYDAVGGDDFCEIAQEYGQRIAKQAEPRLLGEAPKPPVHSLSWWAAARYSRRSTSGLMTMTFPWRSSLLLIPSHCAAVMMLLPSSPARSFNSACLVSSACFAMRCPYSCAISQKSSPPTAS